MILSDIGFDFSDFTIEGFTSRIEELTGRRIFSVPWSMPKGMFGAWLSDGDEPREYFFYRKDVPYIHQNHIRLHELAHFLCDHPTICISRDSITDLLHGGSESLFDLARTRSTSMTELEIEAETLASLIQEQVIQSAQVEQLSQGVSSDKQLATLLNDLGLT
jgi:hypothetical protein